MSKQSRAVISSMPDRLCVTQSGLVGIKLVDKAASIRTADRVDHPAGEAAIHLDLQPHVARRLRAELNALDLGSES